MTPQVTEFLNSIDRQRNKLLAVLENTPASAWNWTPTADESNSMFVIATHSIGSEHGWIFEILGRGPETRDRAAEFHVKGDSLEHVRAEYLRVAQETRTVFESLTEGDIETTRYRQPHGHVTVRGIILHVIEHLSEHLGQIELTKQVWEQHA